MKAPRITVRCECGSEEWVAYGETWECPACGRRYDTSRIPADEYGEVAALDRRYRLTTWGVMAVLAAAVLAVALTHQLVPIFAGLCLVLLSWFIYLKPIVHNRHRKAVGKLTRSWNLEAE